MKPIKDTIKPKGSSQSDVETPRPIIAKPTTHVGVEQQTTQDIVIDAKETNTAPNPAVTLLERRRSGE